MNAVLMSASIPALVIGSMMWTLPTQRKLCVVDGPGMPMFVLAWMIYIFMHATRRS